MGNVTLTRSPTHFFPQNNKEKGVSQREWNSDGDFQGGVGGGMKYPSECNASKNKIAKRKVCMEAELGTGDPGTASALGVWGPMYR